MLRSCEAVQSLLQSLDLTGASDAVCVEALITALPAIQRGDCLSNVEVVLTCDCQAKLRLFSLDKQAILQQQL